MRGYIFEYYKYVRYLKGSMDDIRCVLNYKEAEKSVLTFGDYDRLKVNVVSEFSRYRDLSTLAKAWVGNRQSILLYELEDDSAFIYLETENEYGFQNRKTGEFDNHLFFALTEFNFRNEKHKDVYKDLLSEATKCLRDTIEIEGIDIDFMLMGSLGAFGVAVLWFSDQYTEILRLVSRIREKYGKLFWAAHTTISKNPHAESRADYEEKIEKIEGKAYLQITLKEPIDKLGVLREYGIDSVTHTSGEYDIGIDMSAADVYRNFEKEEIFDHDKDEYQELFLQTHLTLGEFPVKLENKAIVGGYSQINLIQGEDLKKVDKVYKRIRKLIEENIDKTAGLIDTLDSLLCDYRYNVVSADNESWAEDFSYIFLKNLQCIEEVLQMKDQCSEVFMELLRFIMNNLKQQIFHVAESSILNFEIPKCHLRYTGQEDSVLFCYMGIIKEILKVAYNLESCNKQSEIIPLVTVDVVPVIESDLYFDKTVYVSSNEENQEFKILSLNLPHVTFYDIPTYMQYMYHEIYHYIVPRNREVRDYQVGIVLTNFHYSNMIIENLNRILGGNRDSAERIYKFIQPLLYIYILQIYPKVHNEITNIAGKKVDKDAILLVAEVYKDSLLDYLRSSHGYQIWEEGIRNIWSNLDENDDISVSKDALFQLIGNDDEINKVKMFFEQEGENPRQIWEEFNNRDDFSDFLNKIMDGIKEAAADIPMIRFSQMPLDEYLLYYSNNLKNNLVKPEKIDLRDELKELIRLGMVLTNYKEEGETIEECQELYRYKYIAKYFTYSSQNVKEKFEVLSHEVDNWLDYFKKIYHRYLNQTKIFSPQLHAIWEEGDVKGRLKNYNFEDTADIYFKRYRKVYCQYAMSLKDIMEMCACGKDINESYVKAKNEYEDAIFHVNIDMFHLFQCQSSLKQLSEENRIHNEQKRKLIGNEKIPQYVSKEIPIVKSDKKISNIKKYTVHGMRDFWDKYMQVVERLETSCKDVLGKSYPFWYRGQDNYQYGLLPSLMRKGVNLQGKANYLAQYQRQLFEEFKYRADGAPEIMDRSFFNVSDYLTLMQHYSVSTTFMDWSEDVFAALYFAMEKILNHKIEDAEYGAAVFVFSPHLYNEARKYMMKNEAAKTACTEAAFKASMKTADCFDNGIPNIAAHYNEKLYDMFLLGNLEYESENSYGYLKEVELCGQQEMAYLPVAVYTSRLNPRIRAQSGIFLAYNLYAEPSQKVNGAYEYIELERIQEYYLNKCTRAEKKVQFLYKITIEKNAVKEIASALGKMGISKERIYPELSSVGERVNYRAKK